MLRFCPGRDNSLLPLDSVGFTVNRDTLPFMDSYITSQRVVGERVSGHIGIVLCAESLRREAKPTSWLPPGGGETVSDFLKAFPQFIHEQCPET